MSISTQIAPHLPYLRRYARALTGEQASGDAYVMAVLEAIVADPNTLDRELPHRVALYRIFTRLWTSIGINDKPDATADSAGLVAADRRLSAISPLARQAFLLVTVEDFSIDEAALVIERSPDEVSGLIEEAGREIADLVSTDVLIIEDEPLIAMDLEDLVTSLGHRVHSVVRTHRQALQAIDKSYPGIVLADIQLADGSSGIDAVNDLLKSFSAPVIFITAYPERLLTGDRPEPAFLIAKPFRPEMVKAIISQALFFDQKSGTPPHSTVGLPVAK